MIPSYYCVFVQTQEQNHQGSSIIHLKDLFQCAKELDWRGDGLSLILRHKEENEHQGCNGTRYISAI